MLYELNMNYNYEDKKELVVVKPDVSDIIYKVEYYLNHLDELMQVGMEGQKKIQAYFDIDYQKSDRKKFIQKFLDIDFN